MSDDQIRYTLAVVPDWIDADLPTITALEVAMIVSQIHADTDAAHQRAEATWDQMQYGEADRSDVQSADDDYTRLAGINRSLSRLALAAPAIVIEDANKEPKDPKRWRTP